MPGNSKRSKAPEANLGKILPDFLVGCKRVVPKSWFEDGKKYTVLINKKGPTFGIEEQVLEDFLGFTLGGLFEFF